MEAWRHGGKEARRHGGTEAWGHGGMEARRHGCNHYIVKPIQQELLLAKML